MQLKRRKAHMAHARKAAGKVVSRQERSNLRTQVSDLVAHHEYEVQGTEIRQLATVGNDDRGRIRVSPLAQVAPARKRGRLAADWARQAERKSSRGQGSARWADAVGRQGENAPLMVRSELRGPVQRNFAGANASKGDAARNARTAQAMVERLEVSWDAEQACMVSGSALREGRVQYRPERTSLRSKEKLGDMKKG